MFDALDSCRVPAAGIAFNIVLNEACFKIFMIRLQNQISYQKKLTP